MPPSRRQHQQQHTKRVPNGLSYHKNGWKYISISGEPHARGVAYGTLCADDFRSIQKMVRFLMLESYGQTWDYMVGAIARDFKAMTRREFRELYDEMEGITAGLVAEGVETSFDEVLAWNFYCSIPYWFSTLKLEGQGSGTSAAHGAREGGAIRPRRGDHCSAFMAIGREWTANGEIVCAHNSFADFIDGQYAYVVLDLQPAKGHRILMQTSPCWIWSGTDFFVTSAGIIGTETTIGGFLPYKKRVPIGYRIRTAMQYGDTLDDYCRLLLKGNSGDYANSWMFGHIRAKEILRLELGLEYHRIDRTQNGYFIGFNAAYDERIRNLECDNSGFYDIRRHQGARYVRLSELMDQYKGKLSVEVAKRIIADHYDVYLRKSGNPCSRTVCSHYDLDAREYMSQAGRPVPFSPHGALDGIVCDSRLAAKMQWIGRYGNSCGTAFSVAAYKKAHRQFERFCPYIMDRPSRPWTVWGTATGRGIMGKQKTRKRRGKTLQ